MFVFYCDYKKKCNNLLSLKQISITNRIKYKFICETMQKKSEKSRYSHESLIDNVELSQSSFRKLQSQCPVKSRSDGWSV